MRRRTADLSKDDGGLDSLLDTMTNVVGILVLMLVVAQLGVAEVVSRVVSNTEVDQEMIEQTETLLAAKEQEKQELVSILYQPQDIDVDAQREELARKTELLERRKQLLAEKQQERNEYAIKIEQDKRTADEHRQTIAETDQRREELEQLLATSLTEQARLKALLDETEPTESPADVVVAIPNPRPAPQGAKQLMLICANNQLYPVNIDRFRQTAELKTRQLITRFKLIRNATEGIDPDEFTKRYERLKDQDDFFDVEYYVQNNTHPRIRLIPRDGRGAGIKEVANRRSRIHKNLFSRIDPSQYYGRFYVLPDSFEVYTAARQVFGQGEILAGWQPVAQDWTLTSHVPGGIVLGPPPKPQPPPVNPPPPKPPSKPPNLID